MGGQTDNPPPPPQGGTDLWSVAGRGGGTTRKVIWFRERLRWVAVSLRDDYADIFDAVTESDEVS